MFPDHPAGSLCGLSAEWHDPPRWRVDDVLDLLRQSLERDAHLLLVFVPVVDAADAADRMAEHRSAVSASTPARLSSVLAVRRRSWNVQPLTPLALSIAALAFEKPLIGRRPSTVKT